MNPATRSSRLRPLITTLGLALLTLVVATGIARAQEAAADRPVNALATKQAMIQDRLNRLEDRMFRLREKLAETEPESARKLAAALDRAGQLDVKARMQAIADALKDTHRLEETSKEQDALIADLDTLLGVLLNRDPDAERRKAELRRLEEIRRELDDVRNQQSLLREQAADAVRAAREARRIDAALKRVDELLKQQEELSKRTQSPDAGKPADGQPGDQQASLQQQQEDLAAEAERLAREVRRMAGNEGEPGQQGEQADSSPQGNESQQGDQTEKAEQSRQGDQSPNDAQKQAGDQSSKSKAGEASEALKSGADRMHDAAGKIAEGHPDQAADRQKEAMEQLRRARLKLQETKEALERESSSSGGAGEQHDLADRARRLAEKMQGSQDSPGQGQRQNQQQGQGQQGQQQGQQQQGQQSAPGQQNVQRSGEHMDDASKDLDQSETEKAIENQDKALSELEQAQRELEEVLRQMREEEQEEALKNIETRLKEMLAEQTAINASTEPLNQLGNENLSRADKLQCLQLGDRQREQTNAAKTCVRLLEEDGTTVVFPRILGQVADDMDIVAGRLADTNVGSLTIEMQKEILRTLDELVQAAKRARDDQKRRQGMPRGGAMGAAAGGAPPLVPPSAELKMLKRSQLGVNGQTQAAEAALSEGGEAAEDAAKALQRAAKRQAELREMAREMQQRTEQLHGL